MINKTPRKSLASRNGNDILIWIWNNPQHMTSRTNVNHYSNTLKVPHPIQ